MQQLEHEALSISQTRPYSSASPPPTTSPDVVDQRIHELRELFHHLNGRYAWLASNFALLAPIFTEERLRKRQFKPKKQTGTSVVARALFNSCVLDVCTLLLDNEQNRINPSIRRLVGHFLPQQRKKDPLLLDRIATLYSENEAIRRRFRRAAENWADALTADWGELQKASKQFKTLRDRWIAHNEVEWDSTNQTFRPPISSVSELYPALRKVVRIIDRAMANLTRLVLSGEMKQRKFRREIAKISGDFWNLRPSKTFEQQPGQHRHVSPK